MIKTKKNYKYNFNFLFLLLFFTSIFTFGTEPDEVAATEAFATSSSPQVSYSVSGDTTVGSKIKITVNVTNATNIYGGSLDFVYDPKIIDVKSISAGSLFKNAKAFNFNTDSGKTMKSIAIIEQDSNNLKNINNGSLAVIDAVVKGQGNVNLKTTNNVSNLSLGGYTSCVKLSDKFGNKIAYNSTNKNIAFTPFTVKLTTNKPSPQNTNSSIILTAKNPSTSGSYQYKFYYVKNGVSTLIQDYSTKTTCTWIPSSTGNYTLVLETKDSNNIVKQSFLNYVINAPVTLTANKPSPQNINSSITLTAKNPSTSGSYQYKFYYVKNGVSTLIQNYSTKTTCTWIPSSTGNYTLVLETKDSNNIVKQSFLNYVINAPVTLTANKPSPQNINSSITLTAKNPSTSGSYQYKFYYVKNGVSTLIQNYSTKTTCTWMPSSTGNYTLVLETKDSNNIVKQYFLNYIINISS